MFHSRRGFLAGAVAVAATVPQARSATTGKKAATSPEEILALFQSLPGDVAVKIYAPAMNGKPEFVVESNASKPMFVGSGFPPS